MASTFQTVSIENISHLLLSQRTDLKLELVLQWIETADELTGDDTVAAVTGGAANQIKADDDASIEERLAMLAGDVAGAVGDSGLLGDEMGQICHYCWGSDEDDI